MQGAQRAQKNAKCLGGQKNTRWLKIQSSAEIFECSEECKLGGGFKEMQGGWEAGG